MTLHFDVAVSPTLLYHNTIELILQRSRLQEDREAFKLTNIYGNPARERYLLAFVKRQCSSIRNSFRELVCGCQWLMFVGFLTNRPPHHRYVIASLVMTPAHCQTLFTIARLVSVMQVGIQTLDLQHVPDWPF